MKFLMIITSLVFVSMTAHARKVCGVEVGNTPIFLMSQTCNPMSVEEFTSLFRPPANSYKKCNENGKLLVVAIITPSFGIYDFTSPSNYKICKGQKVPVSFESDEQIILSPTEI